VSLRERTFEQIAALTERSLLTTYRRLPVAFVRGAGVRLWDSEGREYLDFLSGLGVCILGHCHPRVVEAIREQAGRLLHTSNLYHIGPQAELADRLSALTGGMRAFFCNSGAEANETALKFVRKWAHQVRGVEAPEVLAATNSFHGRTYGALSLTGQTKYQQGFEPMLPGVSYCRYNDLGDFAARFNERTAAVILEAVQGEAGVYEASDEFLRGIEALCRERQALLIFDEVQAGLGRTGTWFAFQKAGVQPDIITLAKGLAGGVPIGAMLARPGLAEVFAPGNHASTFGGNFLACAAALATLAVLAEENLPARSAEMGKLLRARLEALCPEKGEVKEIRGRGMMQAIEFNLPEAGRSLALDLQSECLGRGLIVNAVSASTVRFLPPLILEEVDLHRGMDLFEEAFAAVGA